MKKLPEILETKDAGSGIECMVCGRTTEAVMREGVRTGGGKVPNSVWRCQDRKACQEYKAGIRL